MIDIIDFYVLGNPIDTEIGECRFLKVKEYPTHLNNLRLISMSKPEIIYTFYKLNKDGVYDELLKQLEEESFYKIIATLPDYKEAYFHIFTEVFGGTEPLEKINEKNFDYYRNLVMKMNAQNEEYVNPNPEIQYHLDRSKRVKSQSGEYTSFGDIVVSVVVGANVSFTEINEWTIYQLYMAYHSIGNFKSYDSSTLFATVVPKQKIESWGKHIDLFKTDDHSITMEEFKKTAKIIEG